MHSFSCTEFAQSCLRLQVCRYLFSSLFLVSSISLARVKYEIDVYVTLLFFYGFTSGEGARDCVSTEWEKESEARPHRETEREAEILYFRNVTRCHCKIWNINASRHSHNRPRTNRPVRSVLFFISMRFYRPWNGICVVSIEIPSLSLAFPSLLLVLFSLVCTPIQNGSRGRNRCYYNAAASSQSLVVEVRPSLNILRSARLNELKPIVINCRESEWCTRRLN